jgi:hypothetical protein
MAADSTKKTARPLTSSAAKLTRARKAVADYARVVQRDNAAVKVDGQKILEQISSRPFDAAGA